MSEANREEEVFEQPFPRAEALVPYLDRWVAFDAKGEVRASGRTFDEVTKAADEAKLDAPTFFFVPKHPLVG